MTKKPLIILAFVSTLVILIVLIWTAYSAKRTSTGIITEFDKVDKSLKESNDNLQKSNEGLLDSMDGAGGFRKDSAYLHKP